MKTLRDLKVGDMVVLVESRGVRDAEITKIGRKYAYVSAGPWLKDSAFDLDTGAERVNWGRYDVIYTHDQYAEKMRRSDLIATLKQHEIVAANYHFIQDTDTLAALVEVLDAHTIADQGDAS